jgi:hypothetical protein
LKEIERLKKEAEAKAEAERLEAIRIEQENQARIQAELQALKIA